MLRVGSTHTHTPDGEVIGKSEDVRGSGAEKVDNI